MPSLLTSHCVLFATAMAVSAGTILFFDLFKYSKIPQKRDKKQALRSCLLSGTEKKKHKKKKVQFADDGKQPKGNGELHRKRTGIQSRSFSCGDEILGLQKMPPNRAALYTGILRDRVQRMEHSY